MSQLGSCAPANTHRRYLVAVIVCAAIVTAGIPAAAERYPGKLQPASLGTPSVAGFLRFENNTTVSVTVPVRSPYRGVLQIAMNAEGQRCGWQLVTSPVDRSRTVSCTIRSRVANLPRMDIGISANLTYSASGGTQRLTTSVQRVLGINDGVALSSAAATTRWRGVSAALDRRIATIPDGPNPAELANRLWYEATRYGWQSSRIPSMVNNLVARRNSDGGFGLAYAWDAFQDGTVNPKTTSYTITTAEQVGWPLLEGYRRGAVPAWIIRLMTDSVLATPWVSSGCLAYSNSRYDARKPCVYNVSFAAGEWLLAVKAVTGYRAADITAKTDAIRAHLRDGYNSATGYWVYLAGSSGAQDISHQAVTARAAQVIDPSFAAVDLMMRRPWWAQLHGLRQPGHWISRAMTQVALFRCTYTTSPGTIYGASLGASDATATKTALLFSAINTRLLLAQCF